MKKAHYYAYRNLHTNTFSIKLRGKVIEHPKNFIMYNAYFKVNEKGRQRVIQDKRKNVHAYVHSARYCGLSVVDARMQLDSYTFEEVTYNPYKFSSFIFKVSES